MQFTSQTGHIHTSRPIWPLRIFVLVQFGLSCPVGPAACINVPVPSILASDIRDVFHERFLTRRQPQHRQGRRNQ